jgi:hypothetical protein
MHRPKYLECQKCGEICPESAHVSDIEPWPCCGAVDAAYEWPELTVITMLNLVDAQDPTDHDQRRVAIMFLATAVELLLEQSLWLLLPKHCKTKELARLTLEWNRGKEKMTTLYKQLSGESISNILKGNGYEVFLSRWDTLTKLRNQIAHGRFYAAVHESEEKERELIENVYQDCIPVFAHIHNYALKVPAKEA